MGIDIDAPGPDDLFFGFCISDFGLRIAEHNDGELSRVLDKADEWWQQKQNDEWARTPSGRCEYDYVRRRSRGSRADFSLDRKLGEMKKKKTDEHDPFKDEMEEKPPEVVRRHDLSRGIVNYYSRPSITRHLSKSNSDKSARARSVTVGSTQDKEKKLGARGFFRNDSLLVP